MTNNFQDFENANILVIDDEVVNLDIIEELLERDGFSNVSFFSDPSEAVNSAAENQGNGAQRSDAF
jgi:CheY-like chemotaxis protein